MCLSYLQIPIRDFIQFLHSLDNILNRIYDNHTNIIICGDFSVNYLETNNIRLQLDSLLASYNLFSTVDLPTRTTYHSSTATDNIFLNINTNTDFSIQPCPNDLSDHGALLLTLNSIQLHIPTKQYTTSRLINQYTLLEFQSKLSYESWNFVFNCEDVDTIFSEFLNTYLRTFNHSFPCKQFANKHNTKPWISRGISFPCKQFANKHNTKPWISRGIIISSQHKRDLFVLCRVTKDTNLMNHYKKYTKILSDVVKSAKYKYYNQLLLNANNKSKTAWNIIKSVTNKKTVNHDISIIDTDGKNVLITRI